MPDLRSLRLSRQDGATVATGFASADRASPELAAQAVRNALARIDAELAGSILLFLTWHFQKSAQPAISAAARTGRCLQVAGCTAPGVLTETDWSLDAPAAAALVLCGNTGLVRPTVREPVITLTATTDTQRQWSADCAARIGILTTTPESGGPGRVWLHGKLCTDGYAEASLSNARVAVAVSRGLRAVTGPMSVTEADGHEIFALDGEPALAALLRHLPADRRAVASLPVPHLFAAVISEPMAAEDALARGDYRLLPILATSQDEQSVTLALPVMPGDRLFWVLRQPKAALQDSAQAVTELAESIPKPDFALMFACIGRGPYYFGSEDRDLGHIRERFPTLPIIGAYGSGEIAPLPEGNALISYSAVMAFASHVQP